MKPSILRPAVAAIAALICLTLAAGCSRRTPEERLEKAALAIKQRDTLTAMLELQELIKKYPDDPRAIDAHYLLAQVYFSDQRADDAIGELKIVLDKSTQKDEAGQAALRSYLSVLAQTKRFEEAKKLIDEYLARYAKDESIALNLAVAKADILTAAKETSAARTLLTGLKKQTTESATLSLYRDMLTRTYIMEGRTTDAIVFLTSEITATTNPQEKRGLMLQVASGYSQAGDYNKTRQWLAEATRLYDAAIKDELDATRKTQLANELALGYLQTGNLAGARATLRQLFDAAGTAPYLQMIVDPLSLALMREGNTSGAIEVLREAAARAPQLPFAAQATQLETLANQNALERLAPPDTTPLVLRFAREELLMPRNLPAPSAQTATAATKTAADAATTETK
ncbi:MAG: tetratricopeptide repeat protein [Candidatus Sumerlaeota bacterium]|nr:tetratricopeptide repeat protein [Candidatus Sumerlaeota bacterium]